MSVCQDVDNHVKILTHDGNGAVSGTPTTISLVLATLKIAEDVFSCTIPIHPTIQSIPNAPEHQRVIR